MPADVQPPHFQACNSASVGYSDFCATWPSQALADEVAPGTAAEIAAAVHAHVSHFPSGIHPGQLAALMRRPCMQRHCLHIYLANGQLYAVAPSDMSPCERNNTQGPCPKASGPSTPPEVLRCRERAGLRSPRCGSDLRRKQPGVTIPGWWSDGPYPHDTEWHFAAALNLTSCYGAAVHGDHNYVFTRLRLQSALRFLRRAYARLYERGRLPAALELVLCAGETPVNFGGYCVGGAQPVWAATTNEAAPLLPYVHWVQLPPRDTDLSVWDPLHSRADVWAGDTDISLTRQAEQSKQARRSSNCTHHARCADSCDVAQKAKVCGFCKCRACSFCATGDTPLPWSRRIGQAVFRGSLFRLSSYTADWRLHGPRRTSYNADNWGTMGRTALVRLKAANPELFNIALGGHGLEGHSDDLPRRLGIPEADWAKQDKPATMPFEEQLRFKYTINAEGHGGWADRLYKMMLHGQLVLSQDLPAKVWYEAPLRPWHDFVPVDASWANLTAAVAWARAHDDEARRIAASAKAHMREWMSAGAMFRYTEELLLGYARLQKVAPKRPPRAVRFECEERQHDAQATGPPHTCWSSGQGVITRGETRCFFESGGQRHSSLYRASLTLAREEDVTAPPLRLREVLSGRATFGGKASRVKKAPQGT